jgi:hypothetical protein
MKPGNAGVSLLTLPTKWPNFDKGGKEIQLRDSTPPGANLESLLQSTAQQTKKETPPDVGGSIH